MLAYGLYLVPIKNEISLSDAYYIFLKGISTISLMHQFFRVSMMLIVPVFNILLIFDNLNKVILCKIIRLALERFHEIPPIIVICLKETNLLAASINGLHGCFILTYIKDH